MHGLRKWNTAHSIFAYEILLGMLCLGNHILRMTSDIFQVLAPFFIENSSSNSVLWRASQSYSLSDE
jgi:hypothetical protein